MVCFRVMAVFAAWRGEHQACENLINKFHNFAEPCHAEVTLKT